MMDYQVSYEVHWIVFLMQATHEAGIIDCWFTSSFKYISHYLVIFGNGDVGGLLAIFYYNIDMTNGESGQSFVMP